MTKFHFALIASAALAAGPAFAQTTAAPAQASAAQPAATPAPQFAVGASVYGPGGNPVGTIQTVGPDYAIVKTDRHQVTLPKTAYAARPQGGLVIGLSRDALNASVDEAMAKLATLMSPGGTVYGTQGGTIGTIEAVEGDLVTVKLASGKAVRLPKAGFAPGPQGLVVGFTAEQLEAQVSAAGAN